MKKLLAFVFSLALLLVLALPANAQTMSGQYLKPKNSVRVNFGSLKNVKSISYTLMYEGNGMGQGVVGTLKPGKSKAMSRDLFLGTCSGKVCTKHKNIKNVQCEATIKYNNGKTVKKLTKVKTF